MALSEEQLEHRMYLRSLDFIHEAILQGKELGHKVAYAKAVSEWNRKLYNRRNQV